MYLTLANSHLSSVSSKMSEELPSGWEKRMSRSSGKYEILPCKVYYSIGANPFEWISRSILLLEYIYKREPVGYTNQAS